jgi:hypothetical protein
MAVRASSKNDDDDDDDDDDTPSNDYDGVRNGESKQVRISLM